MKARARVIGGFVRFGNRRDSNDAAASGQVKGTDAPKAKLLLGGFMALAVTLVLGVALAGAVAPVVTVQNADKVEYTTAHVEGAVNPEGHETSFHFEYITDDQYLANEGNAEPLFQGATEVGNGSTAVTFSPSESLSGLAPATEYHLRLIATNDESETAEDVATSTFTTKAVAKPLVSGLAASETHFSGMVNPNAPEAAPTTAAVEAGFKTHWRFSCSPGCDFTGPSEEDLVADNKATEVSADPVNLTPNQAYDVTLHATNPGGEETETKVAAFTTPAIKPAVATATSTEVSPTSIILNGTVNPHNSPLSDCHFAYGVGGALDQSAPCEGTLPTGEGTTSVHAQLSGLSPGTEYSFQLLATNPAGSAESPTGHFGTPTGAASPVSCSNEAIRVAQQATQVGECRAFERVSPAEKGGGDILAEGASTIAAVDGNAAAFESKIGFADSEGSGAQGRIAYLATRAADGWASHATTPRSNPETNLVFGTGTYLMAYSDDLSHAITQAYDLPGATGDAPKRVNLYVEDTATRGLQTVSGSQTGEGDPLIYPLSEFWEKAENTWGSSQDLRHTSFVAGGQFVPAIPGEYPNGSKNAYTWDEGKIHLAGILPDGTVPPGGSDITPLRYKGSMSADGSRLAFSASAGGPDQVYLRVDHSHTDLVSESENPAFTEESQNVYFDGMTPDGRNVFFITESPLLPEDTSPGRDLYRWTYGPDPENESNNLTIITHSGSAKASFGEQGGTVVGMSDDGNRVYSQGSDGFLLLWDEGITTEIDYLDQQPGQASLALEAFAPGYSRVSPDGNWLAYVKPETLFGGAPTQLFLYDRVADTLTCASCPGPIANPTEKGAFLPYVTKNGGVSLPAFRPRYLGSDGRVFFTTDASLLPEDTNGVADVYSYDGPTGQLSLITSGRGSDPSEFVDASKSGDNVFFFTRAQLVPSDTDEFADLYDARVSGGFDEPDGPPVAPCSGEACQGGSAGPPVAPAIGSGAATRGNVEEKRGRRCGKGQRRVKRHGKVRCIKRKQHPKRQTAHRGDSR